MTVNVRDFFISRPKLLTALCIIFLATIAILTHVQWFNPFSVLQFGDWQYRPDENVKQLISSWTTWVPFNNLGEVNVLLSGYPFRGIAWSFITLLGFSYDIATKITLFIPIALGGFITPFLLGIRLFKDRPISVLLALVYGSTTYFLVTQTTHLPITFIYAFLPLLVLWLDLALDRNQMRYWILLTIGFCIGIFYEIRMMYIVAFILAAYISSFLLTRRVNIKHYIKPILISGTLCLIVNLFWIIPTILGAGSSIGALTDRGLFGNNLFDLSHAFTVMKWNWTGGLVDRSFTLQPIILYLWIVPAIAFLGMTVQSRYRKRMIVFLIVSLAGILLAKQSVEPLAGLYEYLYDHFPGFSLFREASKLYLLVAFGYFGLIGYTLLTLKEVYTKHRNTTAKYLHYAVGALLVIVVSINLIPAITTQIGGTFKPSTMPKDYVVFNNFLKKQPDYFRTYWIPRDSWWGYYDNTHPKMKSNEMLNGAWKAYLKNPGGNRYNVAQNNIDIFNQPFSQDLFSNASVKYVVVPSQNNENGDNFFAAYSNDRDYFTDNLDQVPFLKRINIGASQLTVYENKHFNQYAHASVSQYVTANSTNMLPKLADTATMLGSQIGTINKTNTNHSLKTLDPAFTTTSIDSNEHKLTTVIPKIKDSQFSLMSTNTSSIFYKVASGTLTFYKNPGGELYKDTTPIKKGNNDRFLAAYKIDTTQTYYIEVDNTLEPVDMSGKQRSLGEIGESFQIKRVQKNSPLLIAKSEATSPCSTLQSQFSQRQSLRRPLEIRSISSVQCKTLMSVDIKPKTTYALTMDYRTVNSQRSGIRVTSLDTNQLIQRKDYSVADDEWRSALQIISPPAGTTSLRYQFYGYPEQNYDGSAQNYYTNLTLQELETFATVNLDTSPIQYILNQTERLTYKDESYNFKNLINNSSFEDGPWQKQVNDCHNYNSDDPAISMSIVTQEGKERAGKSALELVAANHTACTSANTISVDEREAYKLGFSFLASNTQSVRYNLRYNDAAKTSVDGYAPVTNKGWQSYENLVTAPRGATGVKLTIYATPNTYGNKKVAIRYDNFQFINVPNIFAKYFVRNDTTAQLQTPDSVDITTLHPTKKIVSITGASRPFYLTINEAFDENWLAEEGISPHIRGLGGVNTWYIDPVAVCKSQTVTCSQSADGYSLKIPIVFKSQRWFDATIWLSMTTLVSTSLALIYVNLRKNK